MRRILTHVLLVLAGAGAAGARTVQERYVFGRATFPVGALPYAVTGADLNGDGRADLAVVNDLDDTVSILLGQPDGTFAGTGAGDEATGVEPRAVAHGDFDGDGDVDLAVVNQNCPSGSCGPGSVSVLLNHGDATFAPAVDYDTDTNPQSVVVADLNRDQKLDLAVVNAVTIISPGPGTVSILLGRGDGTFLPQIVFAAGDGPGDVAVGDFDRDQKLDLAITNYIPLNVVSAVAVLRSNGDGSFAAPVSYPTAIGPVSIATGDLNGDLKLDLVVAALGGNVASVLRGNGDGSFQGHVDYQSGFGPKAVTLGDLDRDGALDLACSLFTGVSSSGAVSLLPGNGDGTFGPRTEYATGPTAASLIVLDVNGDRAEDVVIPDADAHVIALLGNRDGTLAKPKDYATAKNPAALVRADLDGDGHLDLAAAASGASKVSVLIGNGDGTFRAKVDYATGREPLAVIAADLDRDGRLDLVCADALDNKVSVLMGNGDGTFRAKVDYATGVDPESLVAADFDRDGKLDLVCGNRGASTLSFLRGNGDGTLQSKVDFATGSGPLAVGAADFDRDGRLDLANADADAPPFGPGKASVLLGHGDGTFGAHVEWDAGLAPESLAIGDLERDGRADLAVATNLDVFGSIAVLRGKGDGTFEPQVGYATGRFTVHVTAADVNGDHLADLIAVNQGNNTVSLLANQGDGTFDVQGQYGTGNGPAAAVTGDFDGDGRTDLAIANLATSTVSVWLGTRVMALHPAR